LAIDRFSRTAKIISDFYDPIDAETIFLKMASKGPQNSGALFVFGD
jgi:hypothetical protein